MVDLCVDKSVRLLPMQPPYGPPFSHQSVARSSRKIIVLIPWSNDRVHYAHTSGLNQLQVQDFIHRNTNNKVRHFVRDPNVLQHLLWSTQSIISGSVALAALILLELRDGQPANKDIDTTPSKISNFLTHLMGREGYMII
jgi:hypothetical protein